MKIKDLAVLAEGFDPKSEVSVEVELVSGDLLETYAIGWGGNECDGLQLRVCFPEADRAVGFWELMADE